MRSLTPKDEKGAAVQAAPLEVNASVALPEDKRPLCGRQAFLERREADASRFLHLLTHFRETRSPWATYAPDGRLMVDSSPSQRARKPAISGRLTEPEELQVRLGLTLRDLARYFICPDTLPVPFVPFPRPVFANDFLLCWSEDHVKHWLERNWLPEKEQRALRRRWDRTEKDGTLDRHLAWRAREREASRAAREKREAARSAATD